MTGSVGPASAKRDRWAEHRRFVRFLFAAGASVPVNLVARIVFQRWVDFGIAVLLAHVVGMLTAYVLTRLFVFERSGRSTRSELSRFAIVNVASAAVTWAVSVTLAQALFPSIGFRWHPELIAHVTGLAVSSITSFVGHRHFSFARDHERASRLRDR